MRLMRALRSEVLSASCVLELDFLRGDEFECGPGFAVLSAFSLSRSLDVFKLSPSTRHLEDSLRVFGHFVLSSGALAPPGVRLGGRWSVCGVVSI